MSESLIELAKKKLADAEARLEKLDAEVQQAKQDAAGWLAFIERAEGLVSGTVPKKPRKITVQKGSIAAACAVVIRDKGPRSLQALVQELRDAGMGHGSENYPSVVNSALWRRKHDLFEKRDDGLYHLQTRDFELLDPP
jgi:hypothetical protein